MNKNGFTLIELLAVIVVLGIISVITVPKVNEALKKSKRNSYDVSVNNLVETLSRFAIDKKANMLPFSGCSFDFDNEINTCTDLEYSGKLPASGNISVNSDGVVNGSVIYDNETYSIVNSKISKNGASIN